MIANTSRSDSTSTQMWPRAIARTAFPSTCLRSTGFCLSSLARLSRPIVCDGAQPRTITAVKRWLGSKGWAPKDPTFSHQVASVLHFFGRQDEKNEQADRYGGAVSKYGIPTLAYDRRRFSLGRRVSRHRASKETGGSRPVKLGTRKGNRWATVVAARVP